MHKKIISCICHLQCYQLHSKEQWQGQQKVKQQEKVASVTTSPVQVLLIVLFTMVGECGYTLCYCIYVFNFPRFYFWPCDSIYPVSLHLIGCFTLLSVQLVDHLLNGVGCFLKTKETHLCWFVPQKSAMMVQAQAFAPAAVGGSGSWPSCSLCCFSSASSLVSLL